MKYSNEFSLDKKQIQQQRIQRIIQRMQCSHLFLYNKENYQLHNSNLSDLNIPKAPSTEVLSKRKKEDELNTIVKSFDDDADLMAIAKQYVDDIDLNNTAVSFDDIDVNAIADSYPTDIDIDTLPKDIDQDGSKGIQVKKLPDFDLYKEEYIQSELPVIYPKEIEYKKVEAQYFNNLTNNDYTVNELSFQFTGRYIQDEFLQVLDKEKHDTTVVNVGTGDGKSTLAHRLIKYYAEEGFVVIVASPFILITNRDYEQINSITSDHLKVVNYSKLNAINLKEYTDANIHCITINSLLGNPGSDYEEKDRKPSEIKKKYLDNVKEYCEKHNKKVVFFYDEIHAGIGNFRDKYVNNLYRWTALTYKSFVFSATFTEASNVVLEYISKLTDKTLTIYNCKRRKFPKQAHLHLNITERRYTSRDIAPLNFIIKIVKDALVREDKVNILIATQSLVQALTDPQSKEPLAQYLSSLNPNILIGKKESADKKAEFDSKRINIGTTFSTGISIEDPNSTFIIITPVLVGPESQKLASIFMEGAPSIIQAFARVRNGGHIHVFMHKPNRLIRDKYTNSLPSNISNIPTIRHISSNQQSEIVERFYNAYDVHIRILSELSAIDKNKLDFRTRENFILLRSQYELASRFESFGRDVNPFIIWAAFNEQFTNCTLYSVNNIHEPSVKVEINEETITSDLEKLLNPEIGEKIKDKTDKKALDMLFKDLEKANPKKEPSSPVSNEIYYNGRLIKHEHIRYYPKFTRSMINILYKLRFDQELKYDKSMYVLGNIELAKSFKIPKSDKRNNLKAAYMILGKIKNKLDKKVVLEEPLNLSWLDKKLENNFCVALYELRENDFYIDKKTFSFFQNYQFSIEDDGSITFKITNRTKRRKHLRTGLLSLFYETKDKYERINGKRQLVKRITAVKPTPENKLDLLFQ